MRCHLFLEILRRPDTSKLKFFGMIIGAPSSEKRVVYLLGPLFVRGHDDSLSGENIFFREPTCNSALVTTNFLKFQSM